MAENDIPEIDVELPETEIEIPEEYVYSIRADIKIRSGDIVSISEDDIQQYAPSCSMSSQCIPLGTAAAMTFTLTFNNEEYGLTTADLDGAEVHVYAGLNSDATQAFGVWYVDGAEISEQSAFVTISGSDALESRFSGKWKDTADDYPRTLALMAQTMCAAAGVDLETSDFHNAEVVVQKMPEWSAECTLRDVIGYIAACAAGFARMNYRGALEIRNIGSVGGDRITADEYSELSGGGSFTFNCLQYMYEADPDSDEEQEYTRYAVDGSIEDNATNTIQMTGNPLMTAEIANDIARTLNGISYEGATLTWLGNLETLPGDDLIVVDTKGAEHRLILNTHSMTIDGGASASSMSDLPSALSQTEGFSAGGNAFNPDGTINSEAISGLDQKVISAEVAYLNQLTAANIKTSKLVAAMLEATNLWANRIDATTVNTDLLTALAATIVNATAQKIAAGTVTTDALYAALAEISALKVGSLTASDIETDRLAAALAAFTVIAAGTAEFDRATIAHLVADAMNLRFGTADEVFIENLRVAYAQMISAAIGNLCIKASDGNYYTIDVDELGHVTATLATVSEDEINAGQTEGGRAILETNITAESLNTTNLLATYALVNRIDAARIDVDELFARQAFINALTTQKIFSDTSLDVIIGRSNEMNRWFTFDANGFGIRKPAYTDADGVEQPESPWSFLATEAGIRVLKKDLAEPVLSAERDRIVAPNVQIGGMVMQADESGSIVFRKVQ